MSSKNRPTLLLVTGSYPFGQGEEFLEAELPFLVREFGRVCVIPQNAEGVRRDVPPGVDIDVGLSQAVAEMQRRSLRSLILLPWSLLFSRMAALSLRPWRLRRAMGNARHITAVRHWFAEYLANREPCTSDSLLVYCYWKTVVVVGIRFALGRFPGDVKIVSRCHRGDLYDDGGGGASWPFDAVVLRSIDRLFPVSQHGVDYVLSRWPWMNGRVVLCRLGVADQISRAVLTSSEIVICTCSYAVEVKRLDLFIRALAQAGTRCSEQGIYWHHLGDGPLRSQLESLANTLVPANVQFRFHGHLRNEQVREFYRSCRVNAFVNVSSSEGVPVSIMEAQNAGIPIIATRVGGTPEIVNSNNGLLLPENPTVSEVADALVSMLREPRLWAAKGRAARETWNTVSNAEVVYRSFAAGLMQLANGAS